MRARLVSILPFLLGGVATTILVAWAFAIWAHLGDARTQTPIDRVPAPVLDRFGRHAGLEDPGHAGLVIYSRQTPGLCMMEVMPGVGSARGTTPQTRETFAGFPFPCLNASRAGKGMGSNMFTSKSSCAIEVPWNPEVVVHDDYATFRARELPLRPVWPGFLLNTIGYAALLWALIRGPWVLRRALRRLRGLCPRCAYPMGGSVVCTECGTALPARVAPAT